MNVGAYLFAGLIIGLFWVVGFGLLGYAGYSMIRAKQAESWPSTNGTIERSELKTSTSSKGNTSYCVDVAYSYNVLGRNYEGTKVAFGYTGGSDMSEHQRLNEKLSKAAQVKVI